MKRLVKLRSSNLKILITSATLDGVKVSSFFSGCPILNVPGTLFPVEKFYSTERPTNYLESSLKTSLGTIIISFVLINRLILDILRYLGITILMLILIPVWLSTCLSMHLMDECH